MKLTNKLAVVATLSISSLAASAAVLPEWGNPFGLWVGGADYAPGYGHGHQATHGFVVTGASYTICNTRFQTAAAEHAGEAQVSMKPCYLKTTVVHEPGVVGGVSGGIGDTVIDAKVETLFREYKLEQYQREVQNLAEKFNVESFRKEYTNLCQEHAKSNKSEDGEKYCRINK